MLLELLIVVTIATVLSFGLIRFKNSSNSGGKTELQTEMDAVKQAESLKKSIKQHYASTSRAL